jgi:hypothetical protein
MKQKELTLLKNLATPKRNKHNYFKKSQYEEKLTGLYTVKKAFLFELPARKFPY